MESEPRSEEQDLLNRIPKVAGEVAAVYRCNSCGQIFGRRYIPFGLGQGATFNPCLCITTGQRSGSTELLRDEKENRDGE